MNPPGPGRTPPYICRDCGCGERSWTWAAAQRHADQYRHPRIQLVPSPPPPERKP